MTEHRDAEFTDFVADHGGQLLRTACLVTGDTHLGEGRRTVLAVERQSHAARLRGRTDAAPRSGTDPPL